MTRRKPQRARVRILMPIVGMTIYRRWDDGTTAVPVTLDLDQPEALSLYDYLTTSSTYMNHENH